MQEAKTHLSALLSEVEKGAELIITRGKTPVARLTPIDENPAREWGFVPYDLPASFFDALPADELAAWQQ